MASWMLCLLVPPLILVILNLLENEEAGETSATAWSPSFCLGLLPGILRSTMLVPGGWLRAGDTEGWDGDRSSQSVIPNKTLRRTSFASALVPSHSATPLVPE